MLFNINLVFSVIVYYNKALPSFVSYMLFSDSVELSQLLLLLTTIAFCIFFGFYPMFYCIA